MLSSRVSAAALILLTLVLAGCAPSPSAPSHYAPFSQLDLQVGTGAGAVEGNRLSVHYTLWLYDEEAAEHKGLLIESSMGGDPLEFTLGAGSLIEGWEQGVAGMQTGGVRRLVIPPSLGYGPARNNVIPPNATLLFEIELVEIEQAS